METVYKFINTPAFIMVCLVFLQGMFLYALNNLYKTTDRLWFLIRDMTQLMRRIAPPPPLQSPDMATNAAVAQRQAVDNPGYLAAITDELVKAGAWGVDAPTGEIQALVAKALLKHPIMYSSPNGYRFVPTYDPDGSLTDAMSLNFQEQDDKHHLIVMCPITKQAREVSAIHFADGGILELPQWLKSKHATRYEKIFPKT